VSSDEGKILIFKVKSKKDGTFANVKIDSNGFKKLAFSDEKNLMVVTLEGKIYDVQIPDKGGEIKHVSERNLFNLADPELQP
jgi:hypothetical protein